MNENVLQVEIVCVNPDQCRYRGDDVLLDIALTNPRGGEVGFPLTFFQKAGPVVRIVDTRTEVEAFADRSLADLGLLEQFTMIGSGQTVALRILLGEEDLGQFDEHRVDVTIHVTLLTHILVNGSRVEYRGGASYHIVQEPRPSAAD